MPTRLTERIDMPDLCLISAEALVLHEYTDPKRVARMQARLGEVDSALEECRKAAALLQEITGDEKGHLGRAQAYEYLGNAYAALATSPKASAGEARQHMSVARDMLRQTLAIINDARTSSGDLGVNEQWAKDVAAELAKCDAALAK